MVADPVNGTAIMLNPAANFSSLMNPVIFASGEKRKESMPKPRSGGADGQLVMVIDPDVLLALPPVRHFDAGASA